MRNAKIYKILPHLFVDAEWSIWVDANIAVYGNPQELIGLCEGNEVAVFRHPSRNCIYDEAEHSIRRELDDEPVIREQMLRYRHADYPPNNGLASCGVIVRKHTPRLNQLSEQWWAEICRGSVRDQISFPYVFREYFTIPGEIYANPWFQVQAHGTAMRSRTTQRLYDAGRRTRQIVRSGVSAARRHLVS